MADRKHLDYDDDELALDIAEAKLTQPEIAAKHGMSHSMVQKIAQGIARPEMKAIIDAYGDAFVAEAKRIARRAAIDAARTLHRIATSQKGTETERKAAMDVLAHAIGDPAKPEMGTGEVVKVYIGFDPSKV